MNLRPPEPHSGALLGCATPRTVFTQLLLSIAPLLHHLSPHYLRGVPSAPAKDGHTAAPSPQQIHVNGNLAWEMGQESGTVILKDGKEINIDIIVTNVYEKINGHWLMVSHHVQPKPK